MSRGMDCNCAGCGTCFYWNPYHILPFNNDNCGYYRPLCMRSNVSKAVYLPDQPIMKLSGPSTGYEYAVPTTTTTSTTPSRRKLGEADEDEGDVEVVSGAVGAAVGVDTDLDDVVFTQDEEVALSDAIQYARSSSANNANAIDDFDEGRRLQQFIPVNREVNISYEGDSAWWYPERDEDILPCWREVPRRLSYEESSPYSLSEIVLENFNLHNNDCHNQLCFRDIERVFPKAQKCSHGAGGTEEKGLVCYMDHLIPARDLYWYIESRVGRDKNHIARETMNNPFLLPVHILSNHVTRRNESGSWVVS